MPTYEYKCYSCAHQFEIVQKISDPVLKDCPNCKDQTLKRLVSAPAFHLKGSGWYKTDYSSQSSGLNTDSSAKSKDVENKTAPSTPDNSISSNVSKSSSESTSKTSISNGGGSVTSTTSTKSDPSS
ncbi:MAG TPA: zinc ribbon domain-containing protein [Oligoflexia bacterium]|nr:zinc ribbon domain-containing protein [Oligoflexia bacterium]HMP48673.1 zinc ribbon domain-containing protein [Oligoflexia bacterium]